MPIFEYKCQECGQTSEFLIRNPATANTLACPSCKSTNLIRVFSVPSLNKFSAPAPGHTCCGREERCDSTPCSSGGSCCRS